MHFMITKIKTKYIFTLFSYANKDAGDYFHCVPHDSQTFHHNKTLYTVNLE